MAGSQLGRRQSRVFEQESPGRVVERQPGGHVIGDQEPSGFKQVDREGPYLLRVSLNRPESRKKGPNGLPAALDELVGASRTMRKPDPGPTRASRKLRKRNLRPNLSGCV